MKTKQYILLLLLFLTQFMHGQQYPIEITPTYSLRFSLERGLNSQPIAQSHPYVEGSNIFSPAYIEELNHKLAYLEVSSGVQLYVRFVEVTCTFEKVIVIFVNIFVDNLLSLHYE